MELREYSTRPVCLEALEIITRHFRQLEAAIPPARWVPWEDSYNWRFVEQMPEQLLLQKLARQITGVKTVNLLLMAGYLQEIGVLYRTLDEIEEDVLFICFGNITGNWLQAHDEYVKYFWSEDTEDRQPPVQRKKIRAYVNRAFDHPDPSRGDAVGRELHKTYSDYTHARSAPIMSMVHGPPARFDVDGIHDRSAQFPYVHQNPTYFYRCMISACATAKVVLPDQQGSVLFSEMKEFEDQHRELLF